MTRRQGATRPQRLVHGDHTGFVKFVSLASLPTGGADLGAETVKLGL
jgi:hypothetical protein